MILSTTRTGSGTPLILLHGMGSASTIWKGISPALERLFDVITFDLPGHGKTPYDPGQA
ncbi:MAG: alpha/beta fold hydrolase, partial [Actinomycetes bacterium]